MAAAPASAGAGGEVSVRMIPAVSAHADHHPAGVELLQQQRERALNRFVRAVAFWEWAGNAFGALAFLWATGVLLGGFCSDLQPTDFWFAMVIIFIEAFRIFSRNYKSDNQRLFGTTRALRWTNLSFARMLRRPQEGNEVVLIMGLWINLVAWLQIVGKLFSRILQVLLLIVMSKMQLRGASQQTSRSQRCRRLLLMWTVLIAIIVVYALMLCQVMNKLRIPTFFQFRNPLFRGQGYYYYDTRAFELASLSAELLTMAVAALLLIYRPPIIANLTSTSWGRSLLSLAKLISAVCLFFGSVLLVWPSVFEIDGEVVVDQLSIKTKLVVDPNSFIISLTTVVLSLGSLQTPSTENCTLVIGRWIDVTLHMLFLWYLAVGMPVMILNVWGVQISVIASILSLVAVLLIDNLQIPAAVLQVMLSSLQFDSVKYDYHGKKDSPRSPNMVPAIEVFYVLSICQGTFYIMASILGLFSFFPRRLLVLQSKLRGQRGAEAIDLYYESAYSTCMETGLFAARKTVSLASFAKESLSSRSSDETRLAGVVILGNLLHENREKNSTQVLRTKIIRSRETLSTLICMLGWEDTRLNAARVITHFADRLTIAEIPGMLKLLSSLLDAGNNLLACQETSVQIASYNGGNAGSQHTDEQLGQHTQDKHEGCCWVHRCWQQVKDRWSVLEELPLTHQDSLPILGMVILEKLAHDPDNCEEIAKSTYLISKIIGLISYSSDYETSNDEQQLAVICASLSFVRRLASTRDNIGVELRQQLCNSSFLLNNLECLLEDNRSSPELMKLVIDILTKMALDEVARKEIGSCKVTISKLMHAFFGKDGPTNAYYDSDQSLRMAAGEALANLTTEGPANCLVILEETGYEIIKELKNMLYEDEYIYVAASLLQNICAQAKDKLRHQDASNHLSSAFTMVMENIMSVEGKHLEILVGLISQICDMIPESFIHDQLQLQTNQSGLVQKLVGTLNSNRKPNPEHPRMRRVIIEMAISIMKFCPRYATILREEGMMEALSKVEMTPSKVEKHRVFYGNIGVVLESGPSLTALVDTAKGLIHNAASTSAFNQTAMLDSSSGVNIHPCG